jgi:hypothetical protein
MTTQAIFRPENVLRGRSESSFKETTVPSGGGRFRTTKPVPVDRNDVLKNVKWYSEAERQLQIPMPKLPGFGMFFGADSGNTEVTVLPAVVRRCGISDVLGKDGTRYLVVCLQLPEDELVMIPVGRISFNAKYFTCDGGMSKRNDSTSDTNRTAPRFNNEEFSELLSDLKQYYAEGKLKYPPNMLVLDEQGNRTLFKPLEELVVWRHTKGPIEYEEGGLGGTYSLSVLMLLKHKNRENFVGCSGDDLNIVSFSGKFKYYEFEKFVVLYAAMENQSVRTNGTYGRLIRKTEASEEFIALLKQRCVNTPLDDNINELIRGFSSETQLQFAKKINEPINKFVASVMTFMT